MPLACVYHKTEEMRVVSFEERDELVATGQWFKHPDDAKNSKVKERKNEKPINAKPPKNATKLEQPVCEEPTISLI